MPALARRHAVARWPEVHAVSCGLCGNKNRRRKPGQAGYLVSTKDGVLGRGAYQRRAGGRPRGADEAEAVRVELVSPNSKAMEFRRSRRNLGLGVKAVTRPVVVDAFRAADLGGCRVRSSGGPGHGGARQRGGEVAPTASWRASRRGRAPGQRRDSRLGVAIAASPSCSGARAGQGWRRGGEKVEALARGGVTDGPGARERRRSDTTWRRYRVAVAASCRLAVSGKACPRVARLRWLRRSPWTKESRRRDEEAPVVPRWREGLTRRCGGERGGRR